MEQTDSSSLTSSLPAEDATLRGFGLHLTNSSTSWRSSRKSPRKVGSRYSRNCRNSSSILHTATATYLRIFLREPCALRGSRLAHSSIARAEATSTESSRLTLGVAQLEEYTATSNPTVT